MADALLERRCPFCGEKSYGGGSTPKVKDELVYRRRLCLSTVCGRQFVVVEGVISDNARLARSLADYHADCAEGLGPEERGDAA